VRKLNVIVLLVAIVIISGCIPNQDVNVKPATMSDIAIVTTYAPQVKIPRSGVYVLVRTEPENLTSQDALISNRIRTALKDEFKAKGYKYYDDSNLDLLVDYTIVAQQSVSILAQRSQVAGREWMTVVGVPDNFITGSVVVDIIDPKTFEPIWRGLINANIATAPVSEEEKQKRVKYAIQKLLNTFPPK
jgi:hypothetical protein